MTETPMHLIVNTSQEENRWGAFVQEILRKEGLCGFQSHDLQTEAFPPLTGSDTILLSRCWLRRSELDTLVAAVDAGATLVVLMPQPSLAERLGLVPMARVIHPASILLPYGGEEVAVQSHQPVACHTFAEEGAWTIRASATDANGMEPPVPAVVERQFGSGRVVAFLYDVGAAVAAIRFGNPALASLQTLQWKLLHVADMYAGHITPEQGRLPLADLHCASLAAALVSNASQPIARVWYYPDARQTTTGILQSDGDNSRPDEFETLAQAVEARNGTATFYLMKNTQLDERQVEDLRKRGHTIGPHVDPRALDEELHYAIPQALAEETRVFRTRFGACSATLQCHCAPWTGTTTQLPAHMEQGYRLLFAHLSLGTLGADTPMWGRFLCGSASPMKFASPWGEVHDCWQQPVPLYDDSSLVGWFNEQREEVLRELDRYIDDAMHVHHNPVVILSHPKSFCAYSSPVMTHVFDRLHAAGVPICNADEWLSFIDRRQQMRIRQYVQPDGTQSIDVSELDGRFCLLFAVGDAGALAVAINGQAATAEIVNRFGQPHLAVSVDSKTHGSNCTIEVNPNITTKGA